MTIQGHTQKKEKTFNPYSDITEKMWKFPSGLTEDEELVIRILLSFESNEVLYGTFLGEWFNRRGDLQLSYLEAVVSELSSTNGLIEQKNIDGKLFIGLSKIGKLYYLNDSNVLTVDYPVYLLMDRTLCIDGEVIIQNLGIEPRFLYNYYANHSLQSDLLCTYLDIPDRERVEKELIELGESAYSYSHYHAYYKSFAKLEVNGKKRFSKSIHNTTVFYDTELKDIEQVLLKNHYKRHLKSSYLLIDTSGNLLKFALTKLLDTYSDLHNKKPSKSLEALLDIFKNDSSPNRNNDILHNVYDTSSKYLKFNVYTQEYSIVENPYTNHLEGGEILYKIDSKMEWVFITNQNHLKVKLHEFKSFIHLLRNESIEIKGIFPIRKYPILNTTNGIERVYYFINRNGHLKVSTESELQTRNRQVQATLLNKKEKIINVLGNDEGPKKGKLLLVSRKGYIKLLNVWEFKPKHRASKFVIGMRLDDDDEIVYSNIYPDNLDTLHITINGKLYNYNVYDLLSTKMNKGTRCHIVGKEVTDVSVSNSDSNVLL